MNLQTVKKQFKNPQCTGQVIKIQAAWRKWITQKLIKQSQIDFTKIFYQIEQQYQKNDIQDSGMITKIAWKQNKVSYPQILMQNSNIMNDNQNKQLIEKLFEIKAKKESLQNFLEELFNQISERKKYLELHSNFNV